MSDIEYQNAVEIINRAITMDLWSLTDHTKVTRQEFLAALARILEMKIWANVEKAVARAEPPAPVTECAATPPCKCSKLKASLNSMRESLLMTQGLLSQARASMRKEITKPRAELATANERAERAETLAEVREMEADRVTAEKKALHEWFNLEISKERHTRNSYGAERDTAQAGWKEAAEKLRLLETMLRPDGVIGSVAPMVRKTAVHTQSCLNQAASQPCNCGLSAVNIRAGNSIAVVVGQREQMMAIVARFDAQGGKDA